MDKHIKGLGIYITIVALAHLGIYVILNLSPDKLGWLFYFDSRIGLFFFETVIKHREGIPPAVSAWIIEIVCLIIGLSMISGKNLLKVYFIIESILTIPYVLFFLLITAIGMSSNHGFSPAELLLPNIVVLISSIFPLLYAMRILWRIRRNTNLSITDNT